MTLGEKIRYLRTFKGWSQDALAKSLDVHYRKIYKWEHDPQKMTIADIVKVSRAFGIEPEELLKDVSFE